MTTDINLNGSAAEIVKKPVYTTEDSICLLHVSCIQRGNVLPLYSTYQFLSNKLLGSHLANERQLQSLHCRRIPAQD
ncbi:hypothetical protein CDAR_264011 [Caerostris darwini]|uniref:Uncharacterized protein n=1 Tax=Caerostris darwini TaxID=1538125 RepID=A0AAV4TQA9_9ARAC|nr:hypothetical protein CDAR_264011 [Caerostris darwini]